MLTVLFDSFHLTDNHLVSHSRYTRSISNENSTNQSMDVCSINKLDDSVEAMGLCICLVLILLASLVGNSLVVAATFFSKQLRKKVTTLFITSLACSDMFNAVTQIPFIVSYRLHGKFCHSLGSCYVWLLGNIVSTSASILVLFCIAVDRFIAIRFPFKHHVLLSVHRVRIIIAGIWVFAFIWALSGSFMWRHENQMSHAVLSLAITHNKNCVNKNRQFYVASFLGIFIVPLAIMTFTYFMILQIAISQIQAIESLRVVNDIKLENKSKRSESNTSCLECQDTNSADTTGKKEVNHKKHKEKRLRRKELKATKSVAIVYFAFVVCWLPACVINIILQYRPLHFPSLKRKNMSLFLFIYYCFIQFLPCIGTMINPIIYSFSCKQFRSGIRSVLMKIVNKRDAMRTESVSSDRQTIRMRVDSKLKTSFIASSRQEKYYVSSEEERDGSAEIANDAYESSYVSRDERLWNLSLN